MMTLDSFKSARSVLSGVINETNLIYSPAFSRPPAATMFT